MKVPAMTAARKRSLALALFFLELLRFFLFLRGFGRGFFGVFFGVFGFTHVVAPWWVRRLL